MPTRILAAKDFDRFARKAKIRDTTLIEVIERAEQGLVDADLGGGLIKWRIARPNESKAKGFRVLVGFVPERRSVFLFGYAKNEIGNVADPAEEDFRTTANALQRLSEEQIQALIETGALREIER